MLPVALALVLIAVSPTEPVNAPTVEGFAAMPYALVADEGPEIYTRYLPFDGDARAYDLDCVGPPGEACTTELALAVSPPGPTVDLASWECVDTTADDCTIGLASVITFAASGVNARAIGPLVYLAQAEIVPPLPELEEAPGLVAQLVQAIKNKNWQLAVGLIVLLLVMVANYLLLRLKLLADELRKAALPWIAAVSGCLLLFSSTLIAGGSWLEAALAGFATGAVAVGLWEMAIKRILKWLAKRKAKKASP